MHPTIRNAVVLAMILAVLGGCRPSPAPAEFPASSAAQFLPSLRGRSLPAAVTPAAGAPGAEWIGSVGRLVDFKPALVPAGDWKRQLRAREVELVVLGSEEFAEARAEGFDLSEPAAVGQGMMVAAAFREGGKWRGAVNAAVKWAGGRPPR